MTIQRTCSTLLNYILLVTFIGYATLPNKLGMDEDDIGRFLHGSRSTPK
ncbi:MAG: hypothetical protein ACX93T_04100 [Bacteroidota bacterium]